MTYACQCWMHDDVGVGLMFLCRGLQMFVIITDSIVFVVYCETFYAYLTVVMSKTQ